MILAETYEGADGTGYRTFRRSEQDRSPIYRGGYNSDCGSCWYGHRHSEEYHAFQVKPADEAATRGDSK